MSLITTVVDEQPCCPPSNNTPKKNCYPPCDHNHDNLYYRKEVIDQKLEAIELSNGAQTYFGDGTPNPALGNTGDIYVDILTNQFYKRYSTGWDIEYTINLTEYLKAGDNISELVNDVGYITLADVPVSNLQTVTNAGNETTNQIIVRSSTGADYLFMGYTDTSNEATFGWSSGEFGVWYGMVFDNFGNVSFKNYTGALRAVSGAMPPTVGDGSGYGGNYATQPYVDSLIANVPVPTLGAVVAAGNTTNSSIVINSANPGSTGTLYIQNAVSGDTNDIPSIRFSYGSTNTVATIDPAHTFGKGLMFLTNISPNIPTVSSSRSTPKFRLLATDNQPVVDGGDPNTQVAEFYGSVRGKMPTSIGNGSGYVGFYATEPYISSQLGSYLPLAGGTMSGNINMGNNQVNNASGFISGTFSGNYGYLYPSGLTIARLGSGSYPYQVDASNNFSRFSTPIEVGSGTGYEKLRLLAADNRPVEVGGDPNSQVAQFLGSVTGRMPSSVGDGSGYGGQFTTKPYVDSLPRIEAIQQGTNVTITGAGTIASPYIINATGGGGGSYTFENGIHEDAGVVRLGLDLDTVGTTNAGLLIDETTVLAVGEYGDLTEWYGLRFAEGSGSGTGNFGSDVELRNQVNNNVFATIAARKNSSLAPSILLSNSLSSDKEATLSILDSVFVGVRVNNKQDSIGLYVSSSNELMVLDQDGNFGIRYNSDHSALGIQNPRWIPDWGAVLSVSAIEALDEGNGIGYTIRGRNSNNYGSIGLGAVDFSGSQFPSNVNGATGQYSIAFGDSTIASGINSVVFGSFSIASAQGAFAAGNQNTASGISSTALGSYSIASGQSSFTSGNGLTASGDMSSAFGEGSTASGFSSTVFGYYNIANHYSSVAFGRYSTGGAVESVWMVGSPALKVGNGTSEADRSDAYVLFNDGKSTQYGIASYGNDYSSNYTDRSLVDRGYVLSLPRIEAIQQGTNVTITGTGTVADPYVINSSGGGGGAGSLQDTTNIGASTDRAVYFLDETNNPPSTATGRPGIAIRGSWSSGDGGIYWDDGTGKNITGFAGIKLLMSAGNSSYQYLNGSGISTTSFDISSTTISMSTNSNLGTQRSIELSSTAMTVFDVAGSKGLVYGADYSANFTARSLVDKAYVDSLVGSAPTLQQVTEQGNTTNQPFGYTSVLYDSVMLGNSGDGTTAGPAITFNDTNRIYLDYITSSITVKNDSLLTAFTVQGTSRLNGIANYGADYSADFIGTSLVSKDYVDKVSIPVIDTGLQNHIAQPSYKTYLNTRYPNAIPGEIYINGLPFSDDNTAMVKYLGNDDWFVTVKDGGGGGNGVDVSGLAFDALP